ncbi:MAG TPA: sensor domain-containing diguanylate cyclase [Abditibacteriaceae bacterium]|jgi:diguanylate cyclase (GGDEF)-like protein
MPAENLVADTTPSEHSTMLPQLHLESPRYFVESGEAQATVQEKLQSSKPHESALLHAVFDQTPLSTQVFSPAGWTLRVNKAWYELFQLTDEALAEFNILRDPQLSASGVMPLVERAFRGENVRMPAVPFNTRLAGPDPDGKPDTRWIRAEFFPVKDEDDKLKFVVCQHHDITRLHEAENRRGGGSNLQSVIEVERARAEAELINLRNVELEKLAATDPLTGLFNRRHFQRQFEKQNPQAPTFNAPLCIVLFDVDYLKHVNGTFGHGVGDIALQKVAERLMLAVREGDLCARFGGEEFAVILPQTTVDEAFQLMERFRKDIGSQVVKSGNARFSVTVSAGIAAAQEDTEIDISILLRQADDALFSAKRRGRNCTVKYLELHG